jgi:hypothetical protein
MAGKATRNIDMFTMDIMNGTDRARTRERELEAESGSVCSIWNGSVASLRPEVQREAVVHAAAADL